MTLFIHRGRNQKSDYLGSLVTDRNAVFDYRGTSTLAMLMQAFWTGIRLPRADAYVVEGALCLWPAFMRKLFRKTPIVMMVPEPAFDWRKRASLAERVLRFVFGKADYILPISELVASDMQHYAQKPFSIVHHYSTMDREKLLATTPDYGAQNLLVVVSRPREVGRTKGLDRVWAILAELHKRSAEFHLYVIGLDSEKFPLPEAARPFAPFIHLEGLQDPLQYFARCPYVLFPARYDAFPIASIEAALAGVFPLVSPTTGTEEFIHPAVPELVIDGAHPEQYAEKILELHARPVSEQQALAERLRLAAKKYSRENSAKELKIAVDAIRRTVGISLPFHG